MAIETIANVRKLCKNTYSYQKFRCTLCIPLLIPSIEFDAAVLLASMDLLLGWYTVCRLIAVQSNWEHKYCPHCCTIILQDLSACFQHRNDKANNARMDVCVSCHRKCFHVSMQVYDFTVILLSFHSYYNTASVICEK